MNEVLKAMKERRSIRKFKSDMLPKEIIDKLHDVFKAALESPDNIEKSKNANLPLKYMSPEELAQYIKDQEKYIIETVPTLGIH